MCHHALQYDMACQVVGSYDLISHKYTIPPGQKYLPLCVSSLASSDEVTALFTCSQRMKLELLPVGTCETWDKLTPLELPELAEMEVYSIQSDWPELMKDDIKQAHKTEPIIEGYANMNGTDVCLLPPDFCTAIADLNIPELTELPVTVQLTPVVKRGKKKVMLLLMLAILVASCAALLCVAYLPLNGAVDKVPTLLPPVQSEPGTELSVKAEDAVKEESSSADDKTQSQVPESLSPAKNRRADSTSTMVEALQREQKLQAEATRAWREQRRREAEAAEKRRREAEEAAAAEQRRRAPEAEGAARGKAAAPTPRSRESAAPAAGVNKRSTNRSSAAPAPNAHACPERRKIHNSRPGDDTHKALLMGIRQGCAKCKKWMESLELDWTRHNRSFQPYTHYVR